MSIAGEYRAHLSDRGFTSGEADPVQHDLVVGKVGRLVDEGHLLWAAHELYHQTYWLVRSAFGGSLEDHLSGLPRSIAGGLEAIGFQAVAREEAERLLGTASRIVELAG